jgi:hypothetical protein
MSADRQSIDQFLSDSEECKERIKTEQGRLISAYQESIRQIYPHAVAALKQSKDSTRGLLSHYNRWRQLSVAYSLHEDGQVLEKRNTIDKQVKELSMDEFISYIADGPKKSAIDNLGTVMETLDTLAAHQLLPWMRIRRYSEDGKKISEDGND